MPRQTERDDKEFWELTMMASKKATDALSSLASTRRASMTEKAVVHLHKRVMQGLQSLGTLRFQSGPQQDDGEIPLRAIYDASLQAAYILCAPKFREVRAERYLDYAWVEMDRLRSWADTSNSALARGARVSPVRKHGEPELDRHLKRLGNRYRTKNGHWYDAWYKGKAVPGERQVGSLRDVAREVGVEEEYDFLQRNLSAAVHSSFSSLARQPLIDESHLLTWAWHFAFRVLALLLKYYDLDAKKAGLSDKEYEVIQSSRTSFLASS